MAFEINNERVHIFQYNEEKRRITIAYKKFDRGNSRIEIEYAGSIFKKEKNQAWNRSKHLETAFNRLFLKPICIDVEKTSTKHLRQILRNESRILGICSKYRPKETSIDRKYRLTFVKDMMYESFIQSNKRPESLIDEIVFAETKDSEKRRGMINFNTKSIKEEESKVKTMLKLFEVSNKFVNVRA
jgi:hypothetical protein